MRIGCDAAVCDRGKGVGEERRGQKTTCIILIFIFLEEKLGNVFQDLNVLF